ncbi:MAG: ATP phosphoribosyltransferase regulatory subunit [Alphaproteobacteria bacterium]|nr:ATP phosphoribosyltransferase regulatory subunit [Alphaproteobacteria bacterium]
MDDIARRILARHDALDAHALLAETLNTSALQSVLLSVHRHRAASRRPAEALRGFNPLHQPCAVDARALHRAEGVAYEALAEGVDALDLALTVPFGAHHALAGSPQHNVLSTIRDAELLADPTVALALEAARRRREDRGAIVRLASCDRVARLQRLEQPGHTRHFRLFALLTAGRDVGSERFRTDAVLEHLGFYIRLLKGLAAIGYDIRGIEVRVTDTEAVAGLAAAHGVDVHAHKKAAAEALLDQAGAALPRALPPDQLDALALPPRAVQRLQHVRDRVFAALQHDHPDVPAAFDLGRVRQVTYYEGLCFHVFAHGPDGLCLPIADGGLTRWTGALLADRKELAFTSGVGLELLVKLFDQ